LTIRLQGSRIKEKREKKGRKRLKRRKGRGEERAGLEKGIGVTVKVGAYAGSTSNCLI